MKKSLLVIFFLCLLVSCAEETPKVRLLEFKINGLFHSYEAYAYRYTDVEKGIKKACDFHFTLKNTNNPDDSLVFTDGYFRIWLEMRDRIFPK